MKIGLEDCGKKVTKLLLKELPSSLVFKLLRTGKIRVNGKKVDRSYILKEGDEINFDKKEKSYDKGFLESLKIYEDQDFFIINKPPNLASQGGTGIKKSLDDYVGNLMRVHRLDRETSGVLVLTKNIYTARKVSSLLENKVVKKIYIAVVERNIGSGKIQVPIQKVVGKVICDENGKEAITLYKTFKFNDNYVVFLQPLTGRTHQIRAHLSYLNSPVIGDKIYGGKENNRLMLHCLHMEVLGKKFWANIDDFPVKFNDLINMDLYF
jgi:23S rRNA pseudouridine955/2504/2580 synthase